MLCQKRLRLSWKVDACKPLLVGRLDVAITESVTKEVAGRPVWT